MAKKDTSRMFRSYDELYMDKKKRDDRAKELKDNGYYVEKRSISNQQLHPQYVTDFEGPEKDDTGFGNTAYQTHFAKLYKVIAYQNDEEN